MRLALLAAQGLDIKRSVLAFWVGYAAAELEPVYLRLRESGKIAVDDTVAVDVEWLTAKLSNENGGTCERWRSN